MGSHCSFSCLLFTSVSLTVELRESHRPSNTSHGRHQRLINRGRSSPSALDISLCVFQQWYLTKYRCFHLKIEPPPIKHIAWEAPTSHQSREVFSIGLRHFAMCISTVVSDKV